MSFPSVVNVVDGSSNPINGYPGYMCSTYNNSSIAVNMLYFVSSTNPNGFFYFNPQNTNIASFYRISGISNIQDLCIYQTTLYVLSFNGFIYAVSLNPTGIPSSHSSLTGSDTLRNKSSIAYYPPLNFLIVCSNSNSLYYFDLSNSRYTTRTPIASFSNIQTMYVFNNNLYFNNLSSGAYYRIYKGDILTSTSMSVSLYINSAFIVPNGMSLDEGTGTCYIVDYVSGRTSSVLYQINNFLTSPDTPTVIYSSSSLYGSYINGMSYTALSYDRTQLYTNNYESSTNMLLLYPISSIPSIPCLCSGMKIFVIRKGYIPIETIQDGDLVWTPDERIVPVVRVSHRTVIGNMDNLPYRIPKDHFATNIPNDDVLISAYHKVWYKRWQCPKDMEGIRQEVNLLGKRFDYWHLELPEYRTDMMMCQNLPVESFCKN